MKSKYLEMELRSSPHFAKGVSVEMIMRHVVYALLPVVAFSVYSFGFSILLLLSCTIVASLVTEELCSRSRSQGGTLGDFSALITGILLGLTLPPGFPLWMAAIGGVVSIALGKALFGGLGFNLFNPALVGRAFLQAAFPTAITRWSEPFAPGRFTAPLPTTLALPFMKGAPDVVSSATPLAAMKFDHQPTEIGELLLGNVSGSTGETCAVLILLGGIYLAVRRMMDWRIPVGILVSVFLISGLFYLIDPTKPPPLFMLFSGGLMLGAVFMATDMVTSPVTPKGVWIYSIVVGGLTVFIRIWGGLPEGVMYAILLGNAITPLLNHVTQPTVYGVRRRG